MRNLLSNNRYPRGVREGAAMIDAAFMDRAIDLAWTAAGRTRPNPLVGAVVVRAGVIVGEGCHEAYGFDHAEHAALDAAGCRAEGGTLYVTLEPCTHFGQTPPCVTRIIDSGVSRVVVATLDPDERMNGRGVAMLRERGIVVDVGARADRAIALNAGYFKRVMALGPTVTLKMAMTLDGRIASAPNRRDRITGPDAQRFVHELRAEHDAIVVGRRTMQVDRPRLDTRLLDNAHVPVPVVFEGRGESETDYPWAGSGRDFVVVSPTPRSGLERCGGTWIHATAREAGVDVEAAVDGLAAAGMAGIMVEGGAALFGAFLSARRWDVMHLLVAPTVFGAGGFALAPAGVPDVDAYCVGAKEVGRDVLVSYVSGTFRRTVRHRLLEVN